MVTCSCCKQDLDSKHFSKSQKKKGAKWRKCKECVKQRAIEKKPVINTGNVVFNYYQDLITKSNEIISDNVAIVIADFLLHGIRLDGVYEDLEIKPHPIHFDDYGWTILNGNTLFLKKNLTFSWIICDQIKCYRNCKHTPESNPIISNEYYDPLGYTLIEGFYKCLNHKTLRFEAFINSKTIRFNGEIIYSTESISIKANGGEVIGAGSSLILPQIKITNCRLLHQITYDKGFEPYK